MIHLIFGRWGFMFLLICFLGLFSCQSPSPKILIPNVPKGYSSLPFGQEASKEERKEILRVIDRFMLAVNQKDTAITKEILVPGIQKIRYVVKSDTTYFNTSDSDKAFEGFTKLTETFEERYWDATVVSNGYIASVWAPYDFYIDKVFSHCGVDLFFMVRTEEAWKIAHYGYTVDQKNCFQ